MKLMKEDLLRIREIAAEKGTELTPQQIVEILKLVKPDLEIKDEPGLMTWIRQYGNNSTS